MIIEHLSRSHREATTTTTTHNGDLEIYVGSEEIEREITKVDGSCVYIKFESIIRGECTLLVYESESARRVREASTKELICCSLSIPSSSSSRQFLLFPLSAFAFLSTTKRLTAYTPFSQVLGLSLGDQRRHHPICFHSFFFGAAFYHAKIEHRRNGIESESEDEMDFS